MPLSRLSHSFATLIDRLRTPLTVGVGIGAFALHAFTAVTAYSLCNGGPMRYWAAFGAWMLPGVAEAIVAYFAWEATGSRVNGYSIWLLAWVLLVIAALSLQYVARRLTRA